MRDVEGKKGWSLADVAHVMELPFLFNFKGTSLTVSTVARKPIAMPACVILSSAAYSDCLCVLVLFVLEFADSRSS